MLQLPDSLKLFRMSSEQGKEVVKKEEERVGLRNFSTGPVVGPVEKFLMSKKITLKERHSLTLALYDVKSKL